MRVITRYLEILITVVEQAVRPASDNQRWKFERCARQLLARLLQMVQLQMHIGPAPDQLTRIQIALLRHHMRQQRITGDIKRQP